jgi:hypothetical protein
MKKNTMPAAAHNIGLPRSGMTERIMPVTRRSFLRTGAAATACLGVGVPGLLADQMQPTSPYKRANTDWFAKCRFGIGIHWTAQTAGKRGSGKRKPFQTAVANFDLDGFVAAVEHAGADYVLFTACHALQMLPAPNPVIDKIQAGRTCERDLLMELADALAAKGKHFLVYYNHSCNYGGDKKWEQAVGYHAPNKERLAKNLMEIVSWMGDHYKAKVKAWWFDSATSLDPRGPRNSVTTDMTGFQFPWERFTVAAKVGQPARLVTYNAGPNETFLYTTHQDYWANEFHNLKRPAKSRYLDNGLQWHGWTCLEDRRWVHKRPDLPIPSPLYTDEEVIAFVRQCNKHMAPMTFNVGIYRDGTMAPESVEQLRRLNVSLG